MFFSFRLKLVCTIPSLEVNLSIFKLEVVLGCRRKWLVEMWTKKKTVRWWWWRDSDERGLTRAEPQQGRKSGAKLKDWRNGEIFGGHSMLINIFFFARTLFRCCRYSFPISFVLHPQHTTSTFTSCSRFCAALCVVDYRILFSSLFDTSKKKWNYWRARADLDNAVISSRSSYFSARSGFALSPSPRKTSIMIHTQEGASESDGGQWTSSQLSIEKLSMKIFSHSRGALFFSEIFWTF